MKKVLVIVVTFNGLHWLERCLGSVYADADLYVFDNDSTDGSADYVAAHFPQAKLIRSAENLGFSKPNNLGFDYALQHGYDYVYLLNQDAWLEEGALEKLVAAAEANPQYGVLSPLQMTDGYKDLDRQFKKLLRGAGEAKFMSGTEPLEAKRVMAAHWFVPVRVIKQIGSFEEGLFPHWGQDDEWCNRLHFYGLKVGIVPEARAVHDRALREETLEKLVRRNYYTGSLVRLCNPATPLWAGFLYVILFTLVKAVKYRSLLPFKYFRQLLRDLPRVRAHRKALYSSRILTLR
jgi:GT2 family glycosyltransferase